MIKHTWLLFLGVTVNIMHATQHELVDVASIIPDVKLDIRYATTNNFTSKQVYPTIAAQHCFLQKPAAIALAQVQKELAQHGLGLKIFDAYRPHRVQFIFWDLVPDERYVADPKKGSRHNRGCAVDLTLVKFDGTELAMPTEFDDFTEKALATYTGQNKEIAANLALLQNVMTKYGFNVFSTEWWHFDYKGWEKYPVLDISFEELLR